MFKLVVPKMTRNNQGHLETQKFWDELGEEMTKAKNRAGIEPWMLSSERSSTPIGKCLGYTDSTGKFHPA